MRAGRSANLAIGACAVLALAAIGLALGLIAWQERLASTAADAAAGPVTLAPLGTSLRVALVLLLIGLAASLLAAVLAVRAASGLRVPPLPSDEPATSERSGPTVPETFQRPAPVPQGPAFPVSLSRVGHLLSLGGLVRGFCHQLNNELGPIQGYADLLCGDPRLSELHRRQVARVRDATKIALADIRSFGAVVGWSGDPAQVARLGEMAVEAARSAQAAMTTRIDVDAPTGTEVEVTATEAEVGQAVLHLCSAVMPLLGNQDSQIRIAVDSIVAAASPTSESRTLSGHPLEMWSDPADPSRLKLQLGTLRPSWRYGRLRFEFANHGWSRDQLGRMLDPASASEAVMEGDPMSLLGGLMAAAGGVISIDTGPRGPTSVILLWPARIAPEVGAPLELDARGDELDALVIHSSERTAEEISRGLAALGLRVASTTSAVAAAELIAEMGSRCRAIVLAEPGDAAAPQRFTGIDARPLVLQLEAVPNAEELERLAGRLRRQEGKSEPAPT